MDHKASVSPRLRVSHTPVFLSWALRTYFHQMPVCVIWLSFQKTHVLTTKQAEKKLLWMAHFHGRGNNNVNDEKKTNKVKNVSGTATSCFTGQFNFGH